MKLTQKKLTESVNRIVDESELIESANTFAADVNEIRLGYHILGGKWRGFVNAKEAKESLKKRIPKLKPEMVEDQDGRAQVMAQDVLTWASDNGWDGHPVKVWWTARPGVLARAVGEPVDSRKNPTDVLVQFSTGEYLGLSAKSTKSSGDIGFKNPGAGTISKELGLDFQSIVNKIEARVASRYKLPASQRERKAFIRANPKVQLKTAEAGAKVLSALRDLLIDEYERIGEEALRQHILSRWMDAEESYPYYIKVTGRGKNGNYSSSIHDPINNEKFKLLTNGELEIGEVGRDSIGVWADGERIMKMRFKYESEKLASSIKLSGDPY